jgi:hypothetical protein
MDFYLEQGCCHWLGPGPGNYSERRLRQKSICPKGMRSFWNFAAFRPPASIQILAGERAFRRRLKAVPRHVRCFQNELHHFIISR